MSSYCPEMHAHRPRCKQIEAAIEALNIQLESAAKEGIKVDLAIADVGTNSSDACKANSLKIKTVVIHQASKVLF